MSRTFGDIGILFGDVAGSTKLYGLLGDSAALAAVESCIAAMREVVERYEGRVVKTVGDEVMAAFPRPGSAYAAAIEIQRRIERLDTIPGPAGAIRLAVRVGLHFGPAIEDNQDFFGDTVNVAARMASLARGSQIITTGDLIEGLPHPQPTNFRTLDRIAVKGREESVHVVEVLWKDTAGPITVAGGYQSRARTTYRAMLLRYGQGEWTIGDGRPSLVLGRAATCDLVLADNQASRQHATIERRGERWILADHSTNGTFVTFLGLREVQLRREELLLHGSGFISCGQTASRRGSEFVHFELVT